jgi:hypothetical protein
VGADIQDEGLPSFKTFLRRLCKALTTRHSQPAVKAAG